MAKIMSNEEFGRLEGLRPEEINALSREVYQCGLTDLKDKLDYAKNNKYGQLYMYYVLQQLNDVFHCNCSANHMDYRFSAEAVCGLLCSYLYAVEYMHEGLPQQVYEYLGEKSMAFVDELIDQYEDCGIVSAK